MEDSNENTTENEDNKQVVENFYTILPDLYRMARVAYNIQTDQLSTQQEPLLNVMLNAKNFLVNTASSNERLDLINDIVSDNISDAPPAPDSATDNLNVELEKGQGI